jgi:hypothetical protein
LSLKVQLRLLTWPVLLLTALLPTTVPRRGVQDPVAPLASWERCSETPLVLLSPISVTPLGASCQTIHHTSSLKAILKLPYADCGLHMAVNCFSIYLSRSLLRLLTTIGRSSTIVKLSSGGAIALDDVCSSGRKPQ